MKRLLFSALMACLVSIVALAQSEIIHTIKKGETLHSVAAHYGVTEKAIMEANPSIKSLFVPGVKLKIPKAPAKSTDKMNKEKEASTEPSSSQTANQNSTAVDRSDDLWQFCSYGVAYWAPFKTGKGFYGFEGKVFGMNKTGFGGYFQVGFNYGVAPKDKLLDDSAMEGVMFRIGPAYATMITENAYVALPVMLGMTYLTTEFTMNSQGKVNSKLHTNFGFNISPEIGFRYQKAIINAAIEFNYYPHPVKVMGMKGKTDKNLYVGFKIGVGLK